MKPLRVILWLTAGIVVVGLALGIFLASTARAAGEDADTAAVLPASCWEGMCMVKREHLEAVLRSHNAYRGDAKRCSKARES